MWLYGSLLGVVTGATDLGIRIVLVILKKMNTFKITKHTSCSVNLM